MSVRSVPPCRCDRSLPPKSAIGFGYKHAQPMRVTSCGPDKGDFLIKSVRALAGINAMNFEFLWRSAVCLYPNRPSLAVFFFVAPDAPWTPAPLVEGKPPDFDV